MGLVAGVGILLGALVVGYLKFGRSWNGVATAEMRVFPSERDAAYAGSQTIRTAAAVSTLGQGDSVAVLWDTYGRDYWACYVRTSSGQRGWVLCTALQRAP